MHNLIRTLLLLHKNKRIAPHDMDTLLKDEGVHLFTDQDRREQFIDTV